MKPEFSRLLDHLGRTLQERNERYGTKNISGPAQVLARIDDKVARLRDAVNRGEAAPNDWTDLMGYGGIGWLIEQGLWDGRSAVRRVYLAHPSEMETTAKSPAWTVALSLYAAGYAVYWPVKAFMMKATVGHADWIWETNLEAIRRADMIVALMPHATPGVCAELLFGRMLGKTIWVWTATEQQSSLVNFTASRIFGSIDDLIREVQSHEISAAPNAEAPKETLPV